MTRQRDRAGVRRFKKKEERDLLKMKEKGKERELALQGLPLYALLSASLLLNEFASTFRDEYLSRN